MAELSVICDETCTLFVLETNHKDLLISLPLSSTVVMGNGVCFPGIMLAAADIIFTLILDISVATVLVSEGLYENWVQFKTFERVKFRSPNDAPHAHDNKVVAKMDVPVGA